jgi:hypothetical protein
MVLALFENRMCLKPVGTQGNGEHLMRRYSG